MDGLTWVSMRTSFVVTTGDSVGFSGFLLLESFMQVGVVQGEWQWAVSEEVEEIESSKWRKSDVSRPARPRGSSPTKLILGWVYRRKKAVSGELSGNHQ